MTLIDWITQNATLKDTAKMEDFKKLVDDLDYMKNVKTVDEAVDFIKRSEILRKALDRETTARVETHDKNFKEKELPKLEKEITDKVNEKLNPAETPEHKEIREMREREIARDKKDAQRDLKKSLREKAVELKFDPIKAERFYVYGEKALDVMEKEFTERKTFIESEVDRISKERFKGHPAPQTSETEAGKTMKRGDWNELDSKGQRDYIKDGGKLID